MAAGRSSVFVVYRKERQELCPAKTSALRDNLSSSLVCVECEMATRLPSNPVTFEEFAGEQCRVMSSLTVCRAM